MKTRPFSALYRSPLGRLRVRGAGGRISGIAMVTASHRGPEGRMPAPVRRCLDAYFRGKPSGGRFSMNGTPFQKKVWETLRTIPWGGTLSYAELAPRGKNPRAGRAVASAVGRNPVAILVPCHRVIGSDGRLGGYAYGLKKKAWLLRHEKRDRG